MHTYIGWLSEPESRPSFNDLVVRFEELLEDPLRYVLTTIDGLAEDYSTLPTNIPATGDVTYENPFLESISTTTSSPRDNNAVVFPSTEDGAIATFDEVCWYSC